MKQVTTFMLVLTITANSFCQQTNSSPTKINTDYLQKSKHQKTAAWVLLGGGTAMMFTGGIIWGNEVKKKEENAGNDPFGADLGDLDNFCRTPPYSSREYSLIHCITS